MPRMQTIARSIISRSEGGPLFPSPAYSVALTHYYTTLGSWLIWSITTSTLYYLFRRHVFIAKRYPILTLYSSAFSIASSFNLIASFEEWAPEAGWLASISARIWFCYIFGGASLFSNLLRVACLVNEYHGQLIHLGRMGAMSQTTRHPLGLRLFFKLQRLLINTNTFLSSVGAASTSMFGSGAVRSGTAGGQSISGGFASSTISGGFMSGTVSGTMGGLAAGLQRKASATIVVGEKPVVITPLEASNASTMLATPAGGVNTIKPGDPEKPALPRMTVYFAPSTLYRAIAAYAVWQAACAAASSYFAGCLVPIAWRECGDHEVAWVLVYINVTIYLLAIPVLLSSLWSVPDSFLIRSEMVLNIITFSLGFAWYHMSLHIPTIKAWASQYGLTGLPGLFLSALGFNVVSVTMPLAAIAGQATRRMLAAAAAAATADRRPSLAHAPLEQALRNAEQLHRFKLSATEDFCLENILFYEEYMLLAEPGRHDRIYTSTIRGGGHSSGAAARGVVPADLCKMFIKPGARYELNLTDRVRRQIMAHYNTLDFNLQISHLEPAKEEVYRIMTTSMFPRYHQRYGHLVRRQSLISATISRFSGRTTDTFPLNRTVPRS